MPQDVVAAVAQRLGEEASKAEVPRWAPQAVVASPQAAIFVEAAFGRALAVVAAIASLEQLVGPHVVNDLAVQQVLLLQVTAPHLHNKPLTLCTPYFLSDLVMSQTALCG